MKSISITGYKRPPLFRRLLESLIANDLHGWQIEIQLEPSEHAKEYEAIAGELLSSRPYRVTVNAQRLGVRLNPYMLLDRLFSDGAHMVLYLEEDIVISPDVTKLANWFESHGREDMLCLTLMTGGCGSPGYISSPEYEDLLFLTKAFNSYGFALTRQSWLSHMRERWLLDYPTSLDYAGTKTIGWDWSIFHYVCRKQGLYCLSPATARATHTGREDGTHGRPAWHDAAFGDIPLAVSHANDYRIVDTDDLPGVVRRHALLWRQLIEAMLKLSGAETGPARRTELPPPTVADKNSGKPQAFKDFNAAMAAAVARHQAGDGAGAEGAYLAALKHQPRNGDALRLLGGLYLQNRRLEEARAMLRKALIAQPGNPEIHNNLGIASRDLGDTAEAVAQFRRALKLRPAYPEALNNLGGALQAAGKPDEAIACFREAVALKPDYATALRNLGIALRDAGWAEEAVTALQTAAQHAPQDVRVLGDLGLALHQANRHAEALAAYQRALVVQPGHFTVLANLANLLRDLGRAEEAIAHMLEALRLKPDAAEIHINLGAAYWSLNRLDEALASYGEALRLSPLHPEALLNRGTALWAMGRAEAAVADYRAVLALKPGHADALTNLGALAQDAGKLDEALAFYAQALEARPGFPEAGWRKSLILLARGDYEEGWRLYEAGMNRRGLRGISPFQTRRWDGGRVKRLLIWSEQGLGDSLQFVRYAALCRQRAERVIVLCAQPLLRLYRGSPCIDEAYDRINEDQFDAQASLMSLPAIFGTTLDTIPAQVPYLKVAEDVQRQWDARFKARDGRLRVGLVWAGSARENQINANLIDRKRSLTLESLSGLLATPGVEFYNLQKGPPAAQIDAQGLRGRLVDFMPDAADFADTAAIVNNLDLVVTVDTSVAHLAGGLGKPVWILSRYDACWRWLLNRPDSPWYPTARVFGQPSLGDWPAVIAAVTAALGSLAGESRGDKPLSL